MSETDEIAAWLRAQAEADIEARAGEAYCCESCPGSHPPSDRAQDETARAESVLAVLDDYAATLAVKEGIEAKLRAGEDPGPNAGYLEALRELAVYGSVVRKLACGYRHREGWQKSWAR